MSFKSGVVMILVIIVLLGATGGDASAASVGRAIGGSVHWISVAWSTMVGSASA